MAVRGVVGGAGEGRECVHFECLPGELGALPLALARRGQVAVHPASRPDIPSYVASRSCRAAPHEGVRSHVSANVGGQYLRAWKPVVWENVAGWRCMLIAAPFQLHARAPTHLSQSTFSHKRRGPKKL